MTQTPNTPEITPDIASDKGDWYVAIMKSGGRYNAFTGAGSKFYRNWKKNAVRYRLEVMAERFGVSDEIVNHLDGWDSEGRHKLLGYAPLRSLVDRLNSGERLDIQKALDRLCE